MEINGVSCIKGEIHSIVTLMRLNTRWSEQNSRITHGSKTNYEENPTMKSFRKLNEYLEGIFDLREVDCVAYLTPFYQVIISEVAGGILTSACLSSLAKFVSYGFLNLKFPKVKEGITLIANCISLCVFEESDWENDEVILMKLLELSTLAMRCDASILLNVNSAWNMYNTCLSIHSQKRASRILKSEAETALRNLTVITFNRAHHNMMHIDSNGNHMNSYGIVDQNSNNNNYYTTNNNDDNSDYNNNNNNSSITLKQWENLSSHYTFDSTIGITLLLSKIMTKLSNSMDFSLSNIEGVKFALTLINIALEAGGPSLGTIGSLVDVLRFVIFLPIVIIVIVMVDVKIYHNKNTRDIDGIIMIMAVIVSVINSAVI